MLYVIIGKSCSGKTTLANLLENKYNIKRVITSTSRPPRENEIDKVDYNFYTYKIMKEEIIDGQYIEYNEFNGWLYGTKESDIDIEEDSLLVLNPKGYKRLKELYGYKVVCLYLKPPLLIRLKRILKRDRGNYKESIRRFITDYKDFKNIKDVIVIRELTL